MFVGFHGKAQDSTKKFTDKVLTIFPQGNIALGYEYGYLPFLVQTPPPVGNYKAEGRFQIQLKSLPFQASFYYSSLGTISGLNNHFTVRFDAQKFQQQMLEKLKLNELNRLGELDSLGKARQTLKSKLDYLYLVKDRKVTLPVDSSRYLFPDLNDVIDYETILRDSLVELDSLGQFIQNDSIVGDLLTIDSAVITDQLSGASSMLVDTVKHNLPEFNMDAYMDSIGDEINNVTGQIASIEDRMKELDRLNNMSQDSLLDLEKEKIKSPWMRRVNGIMNDVKRLDIGLTYPNYSQFLVSRIPIRGINVEYQHGKVFFACSHGKTVNNIFYSNNVVQNNLNTARNLYNFFDFSNIDDGRRVTAFQFGIGSKKESHVHVGLLYGLGKVSYQDTNQIVDVEKNLVAEIDGAIRIKKEHLVSFSYGRSAIQVNDVNLEEEGGLINRLLDFNDRTNALLGRYAFSSKGSKMALTFRWVDPYFRSFGVGFLRSDNMRYEIKYKQKVGKKLTFTTYFRRENDNLLGLYSYQNVLLSYGGGVSFRPTKHLMLKADVRPITLDGTNDIDSLSVQNNNLIVNGIINYSNRIGDVYFNGTAIYSYYQLTLDEMSQTYQNVNFNLTVEGKFLSESLIFNHYRTTDSSSVPLTSLLQNDLTFKLKAIQLTGTLKCSFTQRHNFDFGYGINFQLKLYKGLSIKGGFEKLVVGDFYNSVYNEEYLDYPYRITSGLVFYW